MATRPVSAETGDSIGRAPAAGAAVGGLVAMVWMAGVVGVLIVLAGAVAGFVAVALATVAIRAAKGHRGTGGDEAVARRRAPTAATPSPGR